MVFLDSKYLSLLSHQLDAFVQKKDNLWNFRCPYCGDSKKKTDKARGYIYEKKSQLKYKCHNCGVQESFWNFLRDQDPGLHKKYLFEKMKGEQRFDGPLIQESNEDKLKKIQKSSEVKYEAFKKEKNAHPMISCIADLDKHHDAVQYLSLIHI